MIHNQQTNKRIQMFWWYEKNLTKHWRRKIDFKTFLIHQATCSTSKNWPIQKPILNTPLQKLNTAVHSLIWNTDNGIEHSKRSSQIFIFYFEIIKCKNLLIYCEHESQILIKIIFLIWCIVNERYSSKIENQSMRMETKYSQILKEW